MIDAPPIPVNPPVTPERTTRLKPSEALRLGSLQWKQAFHTSVEKDFDGNVINACAMATIHLMHARWPHDRVGPVWSPCTCLGFRMGITWVIIHLNDDHQWTRPQIADWLEVTGR